MIHKGGGGGGFLFCLQYTNGNKSIGLMMLPTEKWKPARSLTCESRGVEAARSEQGGCRE